MKRFFVTAIFFFVLSEVFSQKPMIGHTIEDIKDYNRIEFGTSSWEYNVNQNFFTMKTTLPELEITTIYYFRLNELTNVICAHGTQNHVTAAIMALEIVKSMVKVSDKKFYDPDTGLYVEYQLLDNNIHSFIFSTIAGIINPFVFGTLQL